MSIFSRFLGLPSLATAIVGLEVLAISGSVQRGNGSFAPEQEQLEDNDGFCDQAFSGIAGSHTRFASRHTALSGCETLAAEQIAIDGRPRVLTLLRTAADRRVLVSESPSAIKSTSHLEYFSGEQIVALAGAEVSLPRLVERLAALDVRAWQPYSFSRLLYIDASKESPLGVISLLEEVKRLLRDDATVELDRMCFLPTGESSLISTEQWHHERIESEAAWTLTEGSESIIVGIIDSGIDSSIEYFAERRVEGYDFVNDDNDPDDVIGHGTSVFALVAGGPANSTGLDKRCKIMPLKVFEGGMADSSKVALAIEFALAKGARVLNLSGVATTHSETLDAITLNAIEQGMIIVAAAGNAGDDSLPSPASLPPVIAVGAVDRADRIADFSNRGLTLDLIAPGEEILTVGLGGESVTLQGTSLATPIVTATAALMLALDPTLNPRQIYTLLAAGAEDQLGDERDSPGWDQYYGWGRLNVYNSLRILHQRALHCTIDDAGRSTVRWLAATDGESKGIDEIHYSDDLKTWTAARSSSIRFGEHAMWIDEAFVSEAAGGRKGARFYRTRLSAPEIPILTQLPELHVEIKRSDSEPAYDYAILTWGDPPIEASDFIIWRATGDEELSMLAVVAGDARRYDDAAIAECSHRYSISMVVESIGLFPQSDPVAVDFCP